MHLLVSKYIAVICAICLTLPALVNASQNRIALVIGNSEYEHFTLLDNPKNDAQDIAETLDNIGFDVIKVIDASREDMSEALYRFSQKLKPGSMSVIFYAGHGIQSDGENYLIPVTADIEKEYQLADRAVGASVFLKALDANSSGTNLVILDACRDNPLAGSTRSGMRGLAKISREPANTMILYATQANATAADGSGRNGLFTKHLLRAMRDPGNSFARMIDVTASGVKKESNNDQRPQFYSSFTGSNVSLHPNWSPRRYGSDPDTDFYRSIKDSNDIAEFESYLRKFPGGTWVSDANAKIEALRAQSSVVMVEKPTFVFTSPQGSDLSYKGQSDEGFEPNQTQLFLSEGSNTFSLKMKNGRKIYGDIHLNYLDEKVKTAFFGLDPAEGPLPKSKHISAAMRGSPVKYRIKMNTDKGVRQVVNYRLSLRPIRINP